MKKVEAEDFGGTGPKFVVKLEDGDLKGFYPQNADAILELAKEINAISDGMIFLEAPDGEQFAVLADINTLAADIEDILGEL